MFSKKMSCEIQAVERDTLDFSRRAHLSELMDEPCEYDELRSCLHDLEQVNSVTLGYKPTFDWLTRLLPKFPKERPLHIVDVGCGGGDMLRKIEHWAEKKKLAIQLTGIDLNPNAIRAAREFTPASSPIRWVAGDAFSFGHHSSVDIVICSLFTHHLEDKEIVGFLQWIETTARLGWFINDLSRGRKAHVAFTFLSACFRWHRFIRNDGPISIRRAFSIADWLTYAEQAGLAGDLPFIEPRFPGRLCVSRSRLS